MTFNLSKEGALLECRDQMKKIEKYFNDDVKVMMITTLNPTKEKRRVTKKEIQAFRVEFGNPSYLECWNKRKNHKKEVLTAIN